MQALRRILRWWDWGLTLGTLCGDRPRTPHWWACGQAWASLAGARLHVKSQIDLRGLCDAKDCSISSGETLLCVTFLEICSGVVAEGYRSHSRACEMWDSVTESDISGALVRIMLSWFTGVAAGVLKSKDITNSAVSGQQGRDSAAGQDE